MTDDSRFEVLGYPEDTEATIHCTGVVATTHVGPHIDHPSVCARDYMRAAYVRALYDNYHAAGVQYGPSYRTLERMWGGRCGSAVARLLPRFTQQGTAVHPADLDDALCLSAIASSGDDSGSMRLPFAVDMALIQSMAGNLWVVRCFSYASPSVCFYC